ncbi:hypothetical protein C5167_038316 [Papaver somniferum]|uniref:ABC transporter domain-containing protein n=1 Tax=Papaver somniferum TaxID=3469 RepID=A0A4Y7ICJ3_PAPSO|nr:hypothetical protein C5167_038316 [Papaver somniferum]
MKNSSNSAKKLRVATLQNLSIDGDEEYDNKDDDMGEKLVESYERLQVIRADAAESQVSKILAGLGFTKDMQVRATRSFSGGWRMRISLSRELSVQPTFYNLMSLPNILISVLVSGWNNTCVLGRRHSLWSLTTAQQKKVKERVEFIAKKEPKSKGKGKVDEDELTTESPKKWRDYSVEFHFPEPTELTPPLMHLIDVNFSYPNKNDFRLSNVDVGIDMGTRVAILVLNGAGKSTLLNFLVGDLIPTEGRLKRVRN